jgi:LacI family transcriptional regulator
VPVRLLDVANSAGVSVSVASRALNGHAKSYRISDETEAKVKAAAQRLGFRPSRTARSLRTRKTGLIGVIVPDLSNPFFSSISRAVALAAELKGYSVIAADSREETEHELRLLKQLEDRQVEAMVVCPVGIQSSHLQQACQSGTQVILVDRVFPESGLNQVTSDHRGGALNAARLLFRKGHRTIGVLQGLPGTFPNEQRLLGYRDVMRDIGVAIDASLVVGNNFTEASGYHSAKALLKQRADVTALFAFSVPNAMGALRAAQEMGRPVPDTLSIIAFDDSPYADLMNVPLTCVCQNVKRIGELAAQLALQSLGKKSAGRTICHEVKTRLIERNSILKVNC